MLSLFVIQSISDSVNASCYYNNDPSQTTVKDVIDTSADAWAYWDDNLTSNGWGQIHIITNKNSNSDAQSYCAGYVDGYLTAERSRQMIVNNKKNTLPAGYDDWPEKWSEWMSNYSLYIKQQPDTDPYWRRIHLIYKQIEGMHSGIVFKTGLNIPWMDFWFVQAAGDLDDLTTVWELKFGIKKPYIHRDPELSMHCTGMIKLQKDYSDIFFSYNTWSSYSELNAFLKDYQLNIPEYKAHRVMISTRAAHLSSVDDFWTNDQGLFVLETTMHTPNTDLYKDCNTSQVPNFLRVFYAITNSDNGKEFTENFIKENSGTYNNEYIVLDSKVFKKGEKPESGSGLLWIIDQYPGTHYLSKDITEELVDKLYFPSVNVPWFKELFDLAGYPEMQEKEAWRRTFWTYDESPRYKLIERDAPKISDYDEFKDFMRRNNWKEDKILQGEPGQGIESRYDLREGQTLYGTKSCFGGLDSKVARISETYSGLVMEAINSPQYETNPPFKFSDWAGQEGNPAHEGLPETEWTYPWIHFSSTGFNKCSEGDGNQTKCDDLMWCGFCVYDQKCLPGNDKNGPAFGFYCEAGWKVKNILPAYALPLIITVSVVSILFTGALVITSFIYMRKEKKEKDYDQI